MATDRQNPQVCPYCLSNLNAKAEVCPHCTRDVGRLIRAESRVKELESDLGPFEPSIDDAPGRDVPLIAIVVPYYLIVYLANLGVSGLEAGSRFAFLEHLDLALAFLAGALMMMLGRQTNVWVVFAIGFVQPFVELVVNIGWGYISYQDLRNHPVLLLRGLLQTGSMAALGSLAGALPGRRRLTRVQISFSPMLGASGVGLERVGNLLLRIATILATVSSIVAQLIQKP